MNTKSFDGIIAKMKENGIVSKEFSGTFQDFDRYVKEYKEIKTFEELDNVEIFAVGTWNKDKYTSKNLEELTQNFETLKDVVKPPAKIGHSETQEILKKEGLPAAGWVSKLKMVGNKLVADFKDVPKVVKDLIDKRAYKRVSAEIYPKYKNPVDGKVYKNVLRAVAFLGADVPACETLSDVASLYSETNPDGIKVYTFDVEKFNEKGGMGIMSKWRISLDASKQKDEIVKKLSETFGEGVQVAVEDATVTDDEERRKREEELKNKEIKDKKIEELTQQYEAVTKLQEDKDKQIADLQAKIAELEAKLTGASATGEEATKELAEFKKNAKSEAIKSFVKQSIEEGRILPKDEETIVALMGQLDDKSVVKFTKEDKEVSEPIMDVLKKFISGLPKVVEFREIAPQTEHKIYGDKKVSISGVEYDVENIELVQKAEKYAQDNKCAFDVALMKVTTEG